MTPHDILYLALAARIGLLVAVERPEAARAALYAARREAADAALASLQIRISPFPDGDLVVINRTVELKEPS